MANAENHSNTTAAIPETISVGKHIHDSLTQIYPSQISSVQQGIAQQGIIQYGSTQVGVSEGNFDEISSTQIGSTQVSPNQDTISQVSSTQVGLTQVGTFQNGSTQSSFTQIGSTEIGFGKPSTNKVSSTQVGTAQVNFGKSGATKVDSTQINPTKISLSSSIPSQQLFSIHTLTPESISTINNTAQTLWNSLLQPQTPFDINLQLTDSLAKGQLAEAIVTKYEALGVPGIVCTTHKTMN